MKPPSPSRTLALALDAEFKRVAQIEDVPMGDLVEEIAQLLGCTTRMIYNWRSDKWTIPAAYLPVLCKRFDSSHLLNVLTDILKENSNWIADDADLTPDRIIGLSKD